MAAIALGLLALAVLGAIGREDVWNATLAPRIEPRMLPHVFAGIDQTVQRIFAHDSAGLVAFASVLTLWEVSGAVRACMGALTRIYDAEESRPWWIRFPLSFALAAVVIAAVLSAILLVAAVPDFGGGWGLPAMIGRWGLAISLIALAFGLLARFAPAARRAKKWTSLGTALVVSAWIVQSLVFRFYLSAFAEFRTAIGGLVLVLVVTGFFYIAAIVLLVGIEVDELMRKDAK